MVVRTGGCGKGKVVEGLLVCLGRCHGRYVLTPLFGLLRTSFRLVIPLIITTVVSRKVTTSGGSCVFGVKNIVILLTLVKLTYSVATRCFTTGTTMKFSAGIHCTLFSRVRGLSFSRVSAVKASALVAHVADSVGRARSNIGVMLQLFLESPFVMFNTVVVTFAISMGTTLVFIIAVPLLSIIIFSIVLIDVPLFGGMRHKLSRILKRAQRGLSNTHIVHTFGGRRRRAGSFGRDGTCLAGVRVLMKEVSALVGPLACIVVGFTVVTIV